MNYIIPITNATLDLVEELNNGIRPAREYEDTVFDYAGKDSTADIIFAEEPFFWLGDGWEAVTIYVKK